MLIHPIYPSPGIYNHDQKFDVSVVIPLYKSNEVIKEQIDKWHFDDKYSTEIVYVDDKCPFGSKDVIIKEWGKRHQQPVKLVTSVKNNGFAGACNMGALHASGKFLIFLNADTVVTTNWISPMIDLFSSEVGIVGNLQIKQGGEFADTIDSAGSEWSWQFMNFMHIGRHFYAGSPLTTPLYPEKAPIDIMSVGEREMVTGCCLAIPKDIFNRVNGFNQAYKIGYWEDTELNLKVRSLGYKVLFTPKSRIYHKLGHAAISLHQFHETNKKYFVNNWIANGKIDNLVKDIRPYNFTINDECLERIYTTRMTFYRETYRNSPRWDGIKNLSGKKVIVYCEQGLGDQIQFFRYIKQLKTLGCHIILHCATPLHRLFLLNGADEVIDKGSNILPDHDYHTLSMSLPFNLKEDITFPYISISGEITTPCKIGIAWEGSPDHSNNHLRSCPLRYFGFGPYFMLQDKINNQEYLEGANTELYGTELTDFVDTAKVINNLDLVISVDTAVLHLAGAMNKKTYGLLSKPCDHRWQVKNWYPSVELIRQKTSKDWLEVFKPINYVKFQKLPEVY